MIQSSPLLLLVTAGLFGLSALACQSGGVGDPCTPEDEYQQGFNGYGVTEVNIESKSFQCETRVCIVNHFQGRVSCPYGQTETDIAGLSPTDPNRCRIPGTDGKHCVANNQYVDCSTPGSENVDEIKVPAQSQLLTRNAQDTVYCSCRCKGPDTEARYCECPSGYECTELVRELGLPGKSQLAGSYCIKAATTYNPTDQGKLGSETCAEARDANPPLKQSSDNKYNIAEVCGANYANP